MTTTEPTLSDVAGLRGFDTDLYPLWYDDALDTAYRDLDRRMKSDVSDRTRIELLDSLSLMALSEEADHYADELLVLASRMVERERRRRAMLRVAGFTPEARGRLII